MTMPISVGAAGWVLWIATVVIVVGVKIGPKMCHRRRDLVQDRPANPNPPVASAPGRNPFLMMAEAGSVGDAYHRDGFDAFPSVYPPAPSHPYKSAASPTPAQEAALHWAHQL